MLGPNVPKMLKVGTKTWVSRVAGNRYISLALSTTKVEKIFFFQFLTDFNIHDIRKDFKLKSFSEKKFTEANENFPSERSTHTKQTRIKGNFSPKTLIA